jgi:quinol monooxygenase YgiN
METVQLCLDKQGASKTKETTVNSSRSDLIIIATAVAKPGRERELEQALREAAGPTRAQPGCIHFSLHRVKGNASTIIGFERWATEADHQRHIQ